MTFETMMSCYADTINSNVTNFRHDLSSIHTQITCNISDVGHQVITILHTLHGNRT